MEGEDFQGKTVVVSGTDHIASSIAGRFARGGADVVVAGDAARGLAVVESLKNAGARASFESLDVQDPAQSDELARQITRTRQAIDVWINAVGVAQLGPAESLSQGSWQSVLETTLSGSFYCCQAAARQMLDRGRGVIVNVGSVNAYRPIELGVARNVADAGLVMLTQSLGIEWAARGVRVVGVAVGPTPSLASSELFGLGGRHPESTRCERRTPMRRLGGSDELAETVAFLASDEASYIVAETLRVDGGWTAYQLF